MISFKISTPGKVILHGEHAVVYGKTALAGSLDLRTTVSFTELPDKSNNEIRVEFSDVNCSFVIKIGSLMNFFFSEGSIEFDVDFRDKVKEYVTTKIDFNGTPEFLSLEAFVYLLVYTTIKEQIKLRPFDLRLTTQLTIKAGLGSSASFSVCLAASFVHWSHLQKGIERDFNHADLEKISAYAFRSEKIMHDSPSGIDNSVCTYGSLIEYQAEAPIFMLQVPKMKILLVDSKISRNTRDQVKRVERLRKLYPTIIEPILHGIDGISQMARDVFKKLQNMPENDEVTQQTLYEELKVRLSISREFHSRHSNMMICPILLPKFLRAISSLGTNHLFVYLADLYLHKSEIAKCVNRVTSKAGCNLRGGARFLLRGEAYGSRRRWIRVHFAAAA
jgi:mevalonate kinase